MASFIAKIFLLQVFCGFIASCFTIASFKRYKQKNTKILKKLLLSFMFWTLGSIFQALGTYINYILDYKFGSTLFGDPNWFLNWIINLIDQFQFSQLFVLVGTYFFFDFANNVFIEKEKPTIKTIFFIIMIIGVIVYGIINPLFLDRNLRHIFDISYFLTIYVIIIMIPIFINIRKMVKKIGQTTESIKNLRSIEAMALIFTFSMIFFGLESLAPGGPNFFTILACLSSVGSTISGYLGFYKNSLN